MKNYDKTIKKLESLVSNDFEKKLLHACFKNLQNENELRFNNFAYSIRELSRHFLKTLSPDNDVKKCVWYKNETKDINVISRGERIKYAIQGGLTDVFLNREIVEIDYINDLKSKLVKSIELLNKFTHVNENTFDIPQTQIDKQCLQVISAFESFAEMIKECRQIILSTLEDKITNEVIEKAMWEVSDDIDILATHHTINEIDVENHKLTIIESDEITVEANGTIHVILQYGSDGDLRRGDGHEMEDNFPFSSILKVKLAKKLEKSKVEIESYKVDTDSWYE